MMESRRKFIIDCDAGTDDAQAIMMALSHDDVQLLAVTAVVGNTHLCNTAPNVLRVLKCCNRLDIPVYKGCERTLIGNPSPSTGYHGTDGMGNVEIEHVDPIDKSMCQSEHSASALVRLVNQFPGEITLVAVGPLTNVAVAMHLDPDLGKKLNDFFIMGGNIEGKGNVRPGREFNFYCDPEAASFVLGNPGIIPKVTSLEVCYNHSFTWEWYESYVGTRDTPKARFVRAIERLSVTSSHRRGVERYYQMCDQLAMATALRWDIVCEHKLVHADVELTGEHTRGQMVVDWRNKLGKEPNVCVVLKVDQEAFGQLMVKAVE